MSAEEGVKLGQTWVQLNWRKDWIRLMALLEPHIHFGISGSHLLDGLVG